MKYASDFRQIARDALRGNWGVAVLTGFVAPLLGAILWGGGGGTIASSSSSSSGSNFSDALSSWLGDNAISILIAIVTALAIFVVIYAIVIFIISGAAKFGYAIFNLNLVDGKEARFSDLFSQFNRIGSGIIMNLLMGIFTFLWSLLFIIPGIIKIYSYAMTPFILAEHPELSANSAITRSREMMAGNKWRLFCLLFSFIGWGLLICTPFFIALVVFFVMLYAQNIAMLPVALVFCGITFVLFFVGELFLCPYQNAALAAFYRDVSAGYDQTGPVLPSEIIE